MTAVRNLGGIWLRLDANRQQNLLQTLKSAIEETQAPLKADVAEMKSMTDQILALLKEGGGLQSRDS